LGVRIFSQNSLGKTPPGFGPGGFPKFVFPARKGGGRVAVPTGGDLDEMPRGMLLRFPRKKKRNGGGVPKNVFTPWGFHGPPAGGRDWGGGRGTLRWGIGHEGMRV